MSQIAAVRSLLLDMDTGDVFAGRVFAPELPPTEAQHMPRRCVVLSYSGNGGGIGARSYLPVGTYRIDVRCYGGPVEQQGWIEAQELHDQVNLTLKYLRGALYDGVALKVADKESGPLTQRDSDTDWPLIFSSWLITASEAVPA